MGQLHISAPRGQSFMLKQCDVLFQTNFLAAVAAQGEGGFSTTESSQKDSLAQAWACVSARAFYIPH